MARIKFLAGVWLLVLMTPFAVAADAIVFDHVTVLTMNGDEAFENQRVLVDGDRILKISSANDIEIPDGATVIDGMGRFLMPGLGEMHGHLPPSGPQSQAAQDTLFLYVSRGVTTVRGMLGNPVQFAQRDAINAGEIIGPNLYLAAPSLNGRTVSSPAEAERKLRAYAAEGWDLQKIHGGLTRDEYDALMDAAVILDVAVGGHVPEDVGIVHALARRQVSIDHMDGYMAWLGGSDHVLTDEELEKAVSITRESGAWVVPTQALFNLFYGGGDVAALRARNDNHYVTAATVDGWAARIERGNADANPLYAENRQRLLKALADGGVRIALGSDAPQVFSVPGFSIMREIAIMRDAGLTPAQIMEAGARNPGRYFADKDTFGMVAAGHRADLLLLNADPRLDIMNIADQAGVMVAGRWYARDLIETRLAEIADRMAD